MRPGRVAAFYCTGLGWLVVLGVAASNVSWEVDLLRNGHQGPHYPTSIYTIMPVPGTPATAGLPGATGADFSQVYTSAKALLAGRSAYRSPPGHPIDVFGRPSGYPPLTNWIYVPVTFFSYADALTVHTWFWLLVLSAASGYLLFKTGLQRHFWRVLFVFGSLYFLTPIGVTHLERGQFDLIVATACVLALTCVFVPGNHFVLALLCGLLGALKWTSLSFLGCLSAFCFLVSPPARRWTFMAIPVMTALATLSFWRGVQEYWPTIQTYELDASPFGLTFQYFLPRSVAKLMPVLLTLIVAGLILLRGKAAEQRAALLVAVSAPFTTSLMCVAICFGTLSYEYHTVTLLGIVPVMVVWLEHARSVSVWLKATTAGSVALFQSVAFRVFGLGDDFAPRSMSAIYAAAAFFTFVVCICIVMGARTESAAAVDEAVS